MLKIEFEEKSIINFGEDLQETWYVTADKNGYRVEFTTLGAYDEDGEESVGLGAYIAIHEVKYHIPEIMSDIQSKLPEFEIEDDTIMVNAPDIRSSLSYYDESDPESARDRLNTLFGVLVSVLEK